MFAILWRLALFGVCCMTLVIPLVGIFLMPFSGPIAVYCLISAGARIWRRNSGAAELSS